MQINQIIIGGFEMNIYMYEMKSQLRSFIIWTASLILIVCLFMGGIYPIFEESKVDFLNIMEGFPKEFMQTFGMQSADLFSYVGFYNFTFVYIALVASIMAVIVALSIFAREKKMKCLDFIMTKPVSRPKIFGIKVLACLSILVLNNLIYVIINMFLYYKNEQSSELLTRFILASIGVFFTQLVFLAIGLFVGTFSRKIRSISGIATSIGFIAFILSALSNLFEEEAMKFIAPLKYFEPTIVMKEGFFEVKYSITALLIVIFCTVTSYYRFCKSDVHAV